MISPVVVMATWLALSGGLWDSGRGVRVCCRRRWRTFCRFWALLRLDFFIVSRLLHGALLLALPLGSTVPPLPPTLSWTRRGCAACSQEPQAHIVMGR